MRVKSQHKPPTGRPAIQLKVKTILNRIQHFPGFIYQDIRLRGRRRCPSLEIALEAHAAMDGKEAVEAVRAALEADEPYNLITMDIMMPEMDGQVALKEIRLLEEARGIASIYGVKVIMTTTMDDTRNILGAFKSLCDAYVIKPVNKEKLLGYVKAFGLIE